MNHKWKQRSNFNKVDVIIFNFVYVLYRQSRAACSSRRRTSGSQPLAMASRNPGNLLAAACFSALSSFVVGAALVSAAYHRTAGGLQKNKKKGGYIERGSSDTVAIRYAERVSTSGAQHPPLRLGRGRWGAGGHTSLE